MPIIDSLEDVDNFLTLVGGDVTLVMMEERGVSVQACTEIGNFAALMYTAKCLTDGVIVTPDMLLGFVASFSMMLGIELERRGVLDEDHPISD